MPTTVFTTLGWSMQGRDRAGRVMQGIALLAAELRVLASRGRGLSGQVPPFSHPLESQGVSLKFGFLLQPIREFQVGSMLATALAGD